VRGTKRLVLPVEEKKVKTFWEFKKQEKKKINLPEKEGKLKTLYFPNGEKSWSQPKQGGAAEGPGKKTSFIEYSHGKVSQVA